MGTSCLWQALPLIGALLGPASAGWVEHKPYTVNEVYTGCQAMLERRASADQVTECHLTFMEGGFFDQWSARTGRRDCRTGQTVESLAYRFVMAMGKFLRETDAAMQAHVGAKPAKIVFAQALGRLCTG